MDLRRDELGTADACRVQKLKGMTSLISRRLPAAMALCGLLLGACTASQPSGTKSQDMMQIPLTSDIRGTNPGVNRDANTDTIMMHVLEGLVGYREDGTPDLLLADALTVSPDGKRYTFHLREGLVFHNGQPVTSREVVWSWRRYLDPKTNWTCLADFDGTRGAKIESVDAIDPLTVSFTLDRPQPLFLTLMAAISCGGGAVLHPDSVAADGSWREPISTGPYRISSWVRGRYIDMTAFAGYRPLEGEPDGNVRGKTPYERHLRWLIIRDASSRLAALVKGQVDVMPEVPAAEMLQLRRMKDIRIVAAPMLGAYGILVQDRNPLLADLRLREAIAYSIDRRTLARLVTEDTADANPSIVASASPFGVSADTAEALFDPARARALLKAAGYRGQPIVLTTNRRYPAMFNQALLVQAMARQVGLNIKIEVLEWATQMDRWRSGDFQLLSFGFSAKADAAQSYESILGDRDASPGKTWGDPEARRLLAESMMTADMAERRKIFSKLHSEMLHDVPFIGLFSPADTNAIRDGVTGFRSWQFGRARFWGVRRNGTPAS
ncbi:ABC transporter substrate-binding protein [Sphingosinicella microcystinivorans]|nr:ABC transporter substrate-binding protein [Sphingosinicella microcystinivorans]